MSTSRALNITVLLMLKICRAFAYLAQIWVELRPALLTAVDAAGMFPPRLNALFWCVF